MQLHRILQRPFLPPRLLAFLPQWLFIKWYVLPFSTRRTHTVQMHVAGCYVVLIALGDVSLI